MIALQTVLLIISVIWEGAITLVPLTLICLVCFTVIKRDTSILPFAFVAGIILDVFRMQSIGLTSIFYICFLFLILLYQKKYEIYSAPFVLLSVFFGSFAYLYLFGFGEQFMQSGVSAIVAVIIFSTMRFFSEAQEKSQRERFLPV